MSSAYVVEARCLVLVQADDADSAADIANAELEDIAFDIDIISTQPW